MSDEPQKRQAHIQEITSETLNKVIDLARLDPLAPGMALQKDHLKKILEHFRVLRHVNIDGVEPTVVVNHPILHLRPDEIDDTFSPEEALSNARLKFEQYFLSPKVLGAEGPGDGTGNNK